MSARSCMKVKHKRVILRVFSIAFLLGGIVRLFATKRIFELFGMGGLWTEHTYSIYIYRVLGAFVILVGIILLVISRKPDRYSEILKGLAVGFSVIGMVMAIAGCVLKLPLRYYAPDPAFCFVLAAILYRSRT